MAGKLEQGMTGTDVYVDIAQGSVRGEKSGGIFSFRGVPYAAAPVRSRRWRPPEPATWCGEFDATRSGTVAPQVPSRLRLAMGDFEVDQSEDCLHLSVWTPSLSGEKRPVLVWLHGGAWQSGGASLPWYAGSELARRGNIVVVGISYRLAALGWLYVPGQTANVGLLDQEAGLDWVRQNITFFGGDPGRMTVVGQSAGAGSIACMLARRPISERVVLQSAPLGRGVRAADAAAKLSALFLRAAGVADLDEARELPVDALLSAQMSRDVLEALQAEGSARSLFGPVADGEILPLDMEAAFDKAAMTADVLIGYTADEMLAFPGAPAGQAGQLLGDAIFGERSREWASQAKSSGRAAWLYSFDVAPSDRFGACHCVELPFLFRTFGAFNQASMLENLQPSEAERISDEMQAAWIQFVRDGSLPWAQAPYVHHFI